MVTSEVILPENVTRACVWPVREDLPHEWPKYISVLEESVKAPGSRSLTDPIVHDDCPGISL